MNTPRGITLHEEVDMLGKEMSDEQRAQSLAEFLADSAARAAEIGATAAIVILAYKHEGGIRFLNGMHGTPFMLHQAISCSLPHIVDGINNLNIEAKLADQFGDEK